MYQLCLGKKIRLIVIFNATRNKENFLQIRYEKYATILNRKWKQAVTQCTIGKVTNRPFGLLKYTKQLLFQTEVTYGVNNASAIKSQVDS